MALIQLGLMERNAVRWGMGLYGPFTTQAVAALQASLGAQQPTGVYDEAVQAHLAGLLSTPAASAEISAESVEENVDFPAAPKATAAATDERLAMLLSMGFSEDEAQAALSGAHGSLERAADALFARRAQAEAEAEAEAARKAAEEAEAARKAAEAARIAAEEAEAARIAAEEASRFPEEWDELVSDLEEMGFDSEAAKVALKQSDGELKNAVRALVSEERLATPRQ